MTGQIVVVTGGGDWADASVDVLELPEGKNIQELKKTWIELGKRWGFVDWLREQGAKDANVDWVLDEPWEDV